MSQKFCNSILLGNYFLNKTSQLILVGEFAFVVLDFLQGGFSDQIKINLFADFYNEMEISEIFVGIPIKKINFAVNENHWRCSRKILSNLNWYHLLIVWSVMVSGILLLTYVSSYPQEIDWLVFSSEPVVSGKHALKHIFLKFLDGCFCTAIFYRFCIFSNTLRMWIYLTKIMIFSAVSKVYLSILFFNFSLSVQLNHSWSHHLGVMPVSITL